MAPRSKTGRVARGFIPLIASRFGVSAFIVAGISKGHWQHVQQETF